MRFLTLPALCACAMLAGGCGLLPDAPDDEYSGKTAGQIYAMGLSYRRGGDFVKAIEAFEQLEATFPFDAYAQHGMLEMAYAQYRQEEYASAIAVLQRFIEQNPAHPNIAYAHYLRGITYYDYGRTLLHYVLPYIRHNKDPTPWQIAFESFSLLVTSHPNTPYAADARQRTIFLRNLLADYELHVADFYLRRKAYVAVVNRATHALERYHGSPRMDDMLWYLEQGYRHLEMHKLADDARHVRNLNFPGYEARRAATEAEEPTFLGATGDWLSAAVDSGASFVGFDIEEMPTDDFTGQYQMIALQSSTSAPYAASRKPGKVVVSEVPEGYRPDPSADADSIWHQFKSLLGFGDDEPRVVPTAAGDESTEREEAPEIEAVPPDEDGPTGEPLPEPTG